MKQSENTENIWITTTNIKYSIFSSHVISQFSWYVGTVLLKYNFIILGTYILEKEMRQGIKIRHQLDGWAKFSFVENSVLSLTHRRITLIHERISKYYIQSWDEKSISLIQKNANSAPYSKWQIRSVYWQLKMASLVFVIKIIASQSTVECTSL